MTTRANPHGAATAWVVWTNMLFAIVWFLFLSFFCWFLRHLHRWHNWTDFDVLCV